LSESPAPQASSSSSSHRLFSQLPSILAPPNAEISKNLSKPARFMARFFAQIAIYPRLFGTVIVVGFKRRSWGRLFHKLAGWVEEEGMLAGAMACLARSRKRRAQQD
jgi:hypothetical protein